MVLNIVKFPNPVLRAKGKPIGAITDEIRTLAENMLETMRAANGVGLAAQQVGQPLQLTVIDVADVEDRPSTMSIEGKKVDLREWMPLVLLNPQLELGRERITGVEGCLSFPEITAEIPRAAVTKARARLLDGRHHQGQLAAGRRVYERVARLDRAVGRRGEIETRRRNARPRDR